MPRAARRGLAVALALLAGAPAGCGPDGSGASGGPGVGPGVDGRPPAAGGARTDLSQRAIVWAVGDGADGSASAHRVARRIAAGRPDRVLYLGDVYPNGSASDFTSNFAPVYGHLARIMLPTPGNHDWPAHARGYDPYWRRARGGTMPHWYAVRAGGWDLLSLNSEAAHGAGSPQLQWLRSEMAGSRGTCRLAFWHRPRFSAGRHGDQEDTAPLWDTLRGRARVVVAGHDHDLQRLRPRDGITSFVSGAGGAGHYAVGRRADVAFADDRSYGALRLELTPGRARFAFISASGATLDSGSVSCRLR